MKKHFHKISIFWIVFLTFFVSHTTKAAAKKNITSRVNKVRKTLQEKTQATDLLELTGNEFKKDFGEWVNWGNWANWNNWNNWANWANWNNWRNG